MGVTFPDFLVAVDKRRARVFVLAKPHLIAVKIDGVWNYGQHLTDEEIQNNYDLVTDVQLAQKIIKEAKKELRLADPI